MLGPTDVYVLSGMLATEHDGWTLREIAAKLHVDHTLIHRALKRAEAARLYRPLHRQVARVYFEEFAIHAVRYIAPGRLGELTCGVPAAWAAKPISSMIYDENLPPIWPHPLGPARGQALEPLHPSAVKASHDTPTIGRLLSLIDSLRAGDARTREVARTALRDTLYGPDAYPTAR